MEKGYFFFSDACCSISSLKIGFESFILLYTEEHSLVTNTKPQIFIKWMNSFKK